MKSHHVHVHGTVLSGCRDKLPVYFMAVWFWDFLVLDLLVG